VRAPVLFNPFVEKREESKKIKKKRKNLVTGCVFGSAAVNVFFLGVLSAFVKGSWKPPKETFHKISTFLQK
jgi:hypothetical protein